MESTWAVLESTANPGDIQITLQASVIDWAVGSEIIIATTGRLNSQHENEKRIITEISGNGYTLTLNEPLQYIHIGETGLCHRVHIIIINFGIKDSKINAKMH